MMYTRFFKTALAAFLTAAFLALSAQPAQAQDEAQQIRQLLEQRDQQIKSVLGNSQTLTDAQREQLKPLINGVVDFEAMSRQALGPFWSDLTATQKADFVDVFSTVVRAQSLSNLEPYRADVTYDQIDVNGDEAHAVTSTVYRGEPVQVEYDLYRTNGSEWKARDIIIDEVSTVGGYERSFQTVMRKKGFDALMSSLRKKRDEVQQASR